MLTLLALTPFAPPTEHLGGVEATDAVHGGQQHGAGAPVPAVREDVEFHDHVVTCDLSRSRCGLTAPCFAVWQIERIVVPSTP